MPESRFRPKGVWSVVMRSHAGVKSVLLAALIALVPSYASALGSVTDGDVSFAYTSFAQGRGNTSNVDFTGAGTNDMAFESWWFFRVQGERSETALGNTPDFEEYAGSVSRLEFDDPGGAGIFSAILEAEVIDTGDNTGNLFQNLRIWNNSASDLIIDIFHYSDFDLAGTFGNDAAVLTSGSGDIQIDVSDGSLPETASFIGYGADAFDVGTYSTLLRELTDGRETDLDGSGLPFGSGDFTGAFQWSSVVVGAGEAADFLTQFGSNSALLDPEITVIPEPSSALLVGLGLAVLSLRSRHA